jgi:hypothetical protein
MEVKGVIELIAVAAMVLVPGAVILNRICAIICRVRPRGIGARVIQFTAVGMIIPLILITALEDKLSKEALGTIIGALTGYLLSGIGNYDSKEGAGYKKGESNENNNEKK